jgi:hypothetical protein
VACGCFSTSGDAGSTTTLYILRDTVLLGMAIHVFFFENGLASFERVLRKTFTRTDKQQRSR